MLDLFVVSLRIAGTSICSSIVARALCLRDITSIRSFIVFLSYDFDVFTGCSDIARMIVCLNNVVRLAMIHEAFSNKSAGLDAVVFRFDLNFGSDLHLFSLSVGTHSLKTFILYTVLRKSAQVCTEKTLKDRRRFIL